MADNTNRSGGMGREEDLSQKKSGQRGSRKSSRSPSDQSQGRKPGEMDAPHIPEEVKPNF